MKRMSTSNVGKYLFQPTLSLFNTDDNNTLHTSNYGVYNNAPSLSVEPPEKKKKSHDTNSSKPAERKLVERRGHTGPVHKWITSQTTQQVHTIINLYFCTIDGDKERI